MITGYVSIVRSSQACVRLLDSLTLPRSASVICPTRKWWKAIDSILLTYGEEIETLIAQHHWPKWGNNKINDLLKKERNAYKFLHDQSLRLVNQGYTPLEIAEEMKLKITFQDETIFKVMHRV